MKYTVRANSNIALVKYWGKKDEKLKTPLNNSISMTLDSLYTTTSAEIWDKDEVYFSGHEISEKEQAKIIKLIDILRTDHGINKRVKINTENNFPTASGLASSASGFAALAFAANKVFELNLSDIEISKYARLGSGSACRSIYGGFSEWLKGDKADGSDSYAIQVKNEHHWDISMLVVIVDDNKKDKGSTEGMELTVKTCPFYPAWLETISNDLHEVRQGIINQDLERVGLTMEHNCLKMHATMMTTLPSVIYWKPATLEIIQKVKELRELGLPCYFTIDAGANVKILCENYNVNRLKDYLRPSQGIKNMIWCKPGSAPVVL